MKKTNYVIILIPAIILFLLLSLQSVSSNDQMKAPSWQTKDWINLPQGTTSIDVQDFKGKVIYLSFFQKW